MIRFTPPASGLSVSFFHPTDLRSAHMATKPKTIPLPGAWKDQFLRQSMRTMFELRLSQSMIEYLSATADNCHWDRHKYGGISRPDNFVSTASALFKRGLIVRKSQEQIDREQSKANHDRVEGRIDFWDAPSFYMLTPAGEALVELFKVVGLFIESEAAMSNKKRSARS